MRHLTTRIYKDEKDIQIILDLIARVRPAKYLNDYPVKMDIEENLAMAAIRERTRFWFDGPQPVAWAYVDEFNNLRYELDNNYEELLGAKIIEWCETCIRSTLAENESTTLDASCREDYKQRVEFLIKHGFIQTQDTTIYMMRPLSEPIPDAVLPPGFMIRPIAGKQEAEAVAATHRAAFGTEYMTTENRLIIMNTSEYEPSLDLVVVAPDGSIAGNCICSVNEKDRIGHTDPVSTHPDYQRMGLARALLLTGLRLLKERGMESAHLGTSGDNIGMQKSAESVGFTIEYKTIWFSKEVN
jgi:ribosomal protein S18 acetylase RimI-like enzyme